MRTARQNDNCTSRALKSTETVFEVFMENAAAAAVVLAENPYIIDLRQMVRWAFFTLLAIILLALLLKIILDLRKYHYKD
jgi:hypothetical protein